MPAKQKRSWNLKVGLIRNLALRSTLAGFLQPTRAGTRPRRHGDHVQPRHHGSSTRRRSTGAYHAQPPWSRGSRGMSPARGRAPSCPFSPPFWYCPGYSTQPTTRPLPPPLRVCARVKPGMTKRRVVPQAPSFVPLTGFFLSVREWPNKFLAAHKKNFHNNNNHKNKEAPRILFIRISG